MSLNYPVWKYKPGVAPVRVMDMVQDAMLGPEWIEGEDPKPGEELEPQPLKRGPERPKKVE